MDSSMQSSTIITIKIDGIILSVDKNCCKLFGYTLDELIGQPVKKLIPPPYKEQHDQFLTNYAKTRIPKIIGKSRVVEGQHKDGTIFPIRLSVSKVGGSGKVSAVSCGEGTNEGTCPVTGMRGSNPHLNDNNNNNSALSASTNPLECDDETIFIGMIDKLEDKSGSITINTNGIIVSCNQNIEELFGYRANEMIGSNVNMIMPSPHKERHDTYISNYLKGGIPKVIGKVRNVPARHKQGNVFPISLQVEPIKVGPITLFRGKIEKVNEMEAVFLIDGEGLIKSCNQNFVVSLFGYAANELIGENISVLIPKIHQRTTEPAFPTFDETKAPEAKRMKLSQSSSDSWKMPGLHRKELQHRDGSLFPVILEIGTYNDDEGKIMYSARIRRADSETKQVPEHQLKSIGDYYITKTVGQGSYGKVKLAYHRETKEYVAIKILQKAKMLPPELERARRETEILSKLTHPNIVRLIKVVETDTTMNIIMEYAGRTLLSYVLERGGLGEAESRKFFLQLLSAVEYCHTRNIVHRDIKHQNILLDDQLNCKVIDFGLSNFMEEGKMRSTFCGTPAYASPEMIVGKKYVGPEVDIWSMGVVLYSMITGVFPFENVGDIIKGHLKEPNNISRECLDLIKRMLTVDINQRAVLQDILKHPWVLGTLLPADSNASSPPMDHAGVSNTTNSLPNSPTQSSPSVSSSSSLENNVAIPVKVIECTVVSTNTQENNA